MAYTETREIQNPNWLSRMGGAVKGMAVGAVLFLVAFPVLFWNEGRAVKTARRLAEGAGAVVSVGIDRVDAANEGRLVHVSGKAMTKETLSDEAFGVSATAIKLSRSVEIFQWVENKNVKREKKGDKTIETTTYTYKKEWCRAPVDSSGFKEAGHGNPPTALPFSNQELVAKEVTLGAFSLSEANIRKIGGAKEFPFAPDFKLPEALKGQFVNGVIYVPAAKTVAAPAAQAGSPLLAAAQAAVSNAVGSVLHDVAAAPEVGDLRVKFRVVEPHDISLCEKQVGNSFMPWTASDGKAISLQRDGLADAAAMFASAQSSNAMMTWILRLVGFLVMLFGVRMVLAPLSVLVDVIPVLRTIVSAGVGAIAFLVSGVCSLFVIAVAWLFFRPLLAIALIVVAAALIGALVALVLKKKSAV